MNFVQKSPVFAQISFNYRAKTFKKRAEMIKFCEVDE